MNLFEENKYAIVGLFSTFPDWKNMYPDQYGMGQYINDLWFPGNQDEDTTPNWSRSTLGLQEFMESGWKDYMLSMSSGGDVLLPPFKSDARNTLPPMVRNGRLRVPVVAGAGYELESRIHELPPSPYILQFERMHFHYRGKNVETYLYDPEDLKCMPLSDFVTSTETAPGIPHARLFYKLLNDLIEAVKYLHSYGLTLFKGANKLAIQVHNLLPVSQRDPPVIKSRVVIHPFIAGLSVQPWVQYDAFGHPMLVSMVEDYKALHRYYDFMVRADEIINRDPLGRNIEMPFSQLSKDLLSKITNPELNIANPLDEYKLPEIKDVSVENFAAHTGIAVMQLSLSKNAIYRLALDIERISRVCVNETPDYIRTPITQFMNEAEMMNYFTNLIKDNSLITRYQETYERFRSLYAKNKYRVGTKREMVHSTIELPKFIDQKEFIYDLILDRTVILVQDRYDQAQMGSVLDNIRMSFEARELQSSDPIETATGHVRMSGIVFSAFELTSVFYDTPIASQILLYPSDIDLLSVEDVKLIRDFLAGRCMAFTLYNRLSNTGLSHLSGPGSFLEAYEISAGYRRYEVDYKFSLGTRFIDQGVRPFRSWIEEIGVPKYPS